MDKLSVQQRSPKHSAQEKARSKKKKSCRDPIKVVYISNPMKVTTTASEFKDRVQELTGRYSDVAEAAFAAPEPQQLEAPETPRSEPDRAVLGTAVIDSSSTSTGSSSAVSDLGGLFGCVGKPYTSAPLDGNFDDAFYMDYECFTDLCYDLPGEGYNHRSMF